MEVNSEQLKWSEPDVEPIGPFSKIKSDDNSFDPNITCPLSDGGTRPAGFRFCWKGKIVQCGSDGKWFDTNIAC